MRVIVRWAAFAAILGLAGAPRLVHAEEGVALFPRRVVVGVGAREGEIYVINRSSRPVHFEVTLERLRMDEYGAWATAAEPAAGEWFADGLVQLAPRRGDLPPHGKQVVRLQTAAHIAGDEARIHVAVTLAAADNTAVVRLPLLIKNRPNARARVRALRWSAPAAVEVVLEREGTTTAYGAVELVWVRADGRAEPCSRREVAIYPPVGQRVVLIPVQPREPGWRLQARFVDAGSALPN